MLLVHNNYSVMQKKTPLAKGGVALDRLVSVSGFEAEGGDHLLDGETEFCRSWVVWVDRE